MRKKIITLIAAIMLVFLSGIISAYAAGSAVVTFSGPSTVVPGQTYTYTYTLKVTKAAVANANITVGGAFQKVSGGSNLFYDTLPDNTTDTVSGTVTVKVKPTAAHGSIGILAVNTDESTCAELKLDSSGNVTGDPIITTVTGSFSAKVAPAPPAAPRVYSAGKDKLMVTWNAVNSVSGYEIWRSASPSAGYSKISSASGLSYLDTGLTAGKTYYYRIRPYSQVSGSTIKGSLSGYGSATPSSASSALKPSVSASAVFNKTWGSNLGIIVGIKFDCDMTVRIVNANGNTVKNVEYNQPYSIGQHTVYWDGTDLKGNLLPSGTYTIVAIERCQDGTTFYTKKALTFNVVKTPTLSSNSRYPKTSNNRHLIKFSIVQDTKVSIVIRDAAGKSVRYITNKSDLKAGQYSVYWDGKDSKGKVVPSGIYYIYGIQYDADGKYKYSQKKLAVEVSEYPVITSNSRYPKTSNNRHLVKFSIAQDAKVSIVIRDAAGKSIRYLKNKSDLKAGQYSVYWDGKDSKGKVVPSGLYYIYGIQYDENGKYKYSKKKLAVEVSEYPTIASNSYYTRTGTNRHLIKVDIAMPAKVSTVIKDENLKSVIYLENKVSHEDGRINLYWNGKDVKGNNVPNGFYYIYAIQYKADGKYVYTHKKLVLN